MRGNRVEGWATSEIARFQSDPYCSVSIPLLGYADHSPPKEAIMGSPFPAIPCIVCGNPVNLISDLYADENGKAVHEVCYVKSITGSDSNNAISDD